MANFWNLWCPSLLNNLWLILKYNNLHTSVQRCMNFHVWGMPYSLHWYSFKFTFLLYKMITLLFLWTVSHTVMVSEWFTVFAVYFFPLHILSYTCKSQHSSEKIQVYSFTFGSILHFLYIFVCFSSWNFTQ